MHSIETGVSIVIPSLNEQSTVGLVVKQAFHALEALNIPGEVIVADNGSTDRTREEAEKAGARIVPVKQKGYGSTLHVGIMAARYSWVVFGDADLSYPMKEIPKLIAPLRNGTADLVLGTRLKGTIDPGAMPPLNRYVGTPVLSWLIRTLFGLPTSDCNSGMRAIRKSAYERLGLCCPGMEYASEMLIRAAQAGLRYAEVPISLHKDGRPRPPHLRPLRDGWRNLRFIVAIASSRRVIALPLLTGFALLGYAFKLSLSTLWAPNEPILYHRAFTAIALAVPPLLVCVSLLMSKASLHASGRNPSDLIEWLLKESDRGTPLFVSIFFFGCVFFEIAYVAIRWSQVNWGPLNEIGSVVRIGIFLGIATVAFSLDMGLGIIRLIPSVPPRALAEMPG